ncbi:hypothetical protein Saga11_20970 [Bacillus safensis]|nr:hypothetical protein Saga11_20970 [Bacillus safensis]
MNSLITEDHVMTVLEKETVHSLNQNIQINIYLRRINPVTWQKEKNNQNRIKELDQEARPAQQVPLDQRDLLDLLAG